MWCDGALTLFLRYELFELLGGQGLTYALAFRDETCLDDTRRAG